MRLMGMINIPVITHLMWIIIMVVTFDQE